MVSLYIHIPFCKKACHYCDFHFSTSLKHKDDMLAAIKKEIILRKDELGESLSSVYFGGGTPSLLSRNEISSLLSTVKDTFDLEHDIELTLEANPDDLTQEKVDELAQVGINRLSIGVQTTDDESLRQLNRAHDLATADAAIRRVRAAGFDNISLDLMFALPHQELSSVARDLDRFLHWQPEHISCYGLTIEKGTAFGNWYQKGMLEVPEEELAAQQFLYIMDRLAEADYEGYEISNFARAGYRSRHNSGYWRGVHYLGVGPSAHSYDGKSRSFNIANNTRYIRGIASGEPLREKEELSTIDQLNEYILLSLRRIEGLDLRELERRFGWRLNAYQKQRLSSWTADGLVKWNDELVYLTKAGRLVADSLIGELFVEEMPED
ncbi:MAG: radical SAM family heme chaperone HemW [Cyclobacteriaceae bacterium]|nr:radical SAM family heme chaperone HemW [Cyclobacteriaceae bacterium]MCH8516838.1 radical SAM family heme chaperone HemW [Cyclobacteriaceae bacterium]